ncbi:MAG: hypothetical protein R6U37_09145 [Dehalococcoidia bacterium]
MKRGWPFITLILIPALLIPTAGCRSATRGKAGMEKAAFDISREGKVTVD